mgnify:CR=1 FL=1
MAIAPDADRWEVDDIDDAVGGLDRFEEGDATDLQGLPDAGFDAVISIFGAMFAPRPLDVAKEMARVCKPGGRIVFVEYRGEDPDVPIKPLHKMTEAQVKKEMTAQPLEYVETIRTLPRQHLIIFRKKAAK